MPLDDGNRLSELIPGIELVADDQGRLRLVHVAGTDVTARVHSPRVDRSVSEVSRQPEVRDGLRPIQRMLEAPGRIIVAGRDIGTVVLPQADLKRYLDVSVEERAERRARERGLDPSGPEADAIRAELRRRDELDTARTIAPLRVPDGARVISSGGNELQETITQVVAAIREAEAARRP